MLLTDMRWLPKAALGVKTELGFNFRPPKSRWCSSCFETLSPLSLQLNSWLSIKAAEKFHCLLFGFPLEQA